MLAFVETKPAVTLQPQFRQSTGRFTQVNYQFALGSCVFEQRPYVWRQSIGRPSVSAENNCQVLRKRPHMRACRLQIL